MKLLKFKRDNCLYPEYGLLSEDTVQPIEDLRTIGEIFLAYKRNRIETGKPLPLQGLRLLPPVDPSTHIYCAGLNYLDHAREMRLPVPAEPVFFSKSSSCLAGPHDSIIRPPSVQLLDYEIELAVVIGAHIGIDDIVTPENLDSRILGITILNDVSSRDHQMRAGQWFLGKNFRTFAPVGPYIQVLDAQVLERLYDLELYLQVYTENRIAYPFKVQRGSTADMVFRLHRLINTLTERFDLRPGDVISTGTPRGVAMSQPKIWKTKTFEILGKRQQKKVEQFIRNEVLHNRKYLLDGDSIFSTIRSADGVVDLGMQHNTVIATTQEACHGLHAHMERN